jgi:hypothetical protein
LKACISRQILSDTLPDKNFVTKINQHDLKVLVGLAGALACGASLEES